jgi:hypothetical protein
MTYNACVHFITFARGVSPLIFVAFKFGLLSPPTIYQDVSTSVALGLQEGRGEKPTQSKKRLMELA